MNFEKIIVFLFAFLASFICTIPTIYIAKKLKLTTDVKKRKHPAHTHKGIIPRGGGVPIYIALLLSAFFFLEINNIIIGILIACFLLVVVGLLDDYYDLSPYKRFFWNILISMIVVTAGLGVPYVSNPFGDIIRLDQWELVIDLFGEHSILIVSNLISILWLAAIMNMVNWSKGVDGQLPGFVAITAFFLAILAQRFTSHDISVRNVEYLSLIVSAAYFGFLPFNMYPQRIMPGYGGGALAGFLLGILAILSFGKIGTVILILAVPIIDAMYTILRRLKENKSPFRADWGHFHHRLLEIGWGRRRIALFYWIVSFILGIASLLFEGSEKMIALISVGFLLLIFIVLINRIKTIESNMCKNNV